MSGLPIFVLGFMASGKSSTGKRIAKKLGVEFVDLDAVIEEQVGKTITQIFQEQGEANFRKIETETLKQISKGEKKLVALGGGTPCYNNNMELINELGFSIYFYLSNEMIVGRLRQNRSKRPLVAHLNDSELKEMVYSKMDERTSYYEQAQLKVDVSRLDMNRLVELIQLSLSF